MKKKTFNVLFAMVLGVSFSLMAAPAIASSFTLTINESPSPVFPPPIPDQAYVIKDNVNYKLYYADNDFASIRLAQSPDGITWTPYGIVISGEGYHADVKYYSTGFTGANSGTNPSSLTMYYRMWYGELYQHSIDGWRYAESPDGINWYNRMPVTQGAGPLVWGPYMGVHYGIADAIYTPGASNTGTDWAFRIYANVQWEDGAYGGKELVVMAFSSNGYEWTGYDPTNVGYATPVFTPSLDPSRFDCDHIGWFKVIKNSPTDWEAFYSGGKQTTYKALNGIGYATSTDGINWTRRQTLFTTSDGVAWRSQSVWMPSVVKTGSNYQIWFLGSNNPNLDSSDWIQWKLGGANLTVAHTPTPCDWIEYASNPLLGQGLGNPNRAYYPKVIYDLNQFSGHGESAYYKMWFNTYNGTSNNYSIRYAYSNDGISWTEATPVNGLASSSGHPLVKYDPGGFGGSGYYYKIWYWIGNQTNTIKDLRYAESSDGINWIHDQEFTQDDTSKLVTGIYPDWNEISNGPCDLIYNPNGSFDNVTLWNNKYVLYYMGNNGDHEFIGLAYSDNGTHWKRYGNDPVLRPCTEDNDPSVGWDYYSVGYCSVIKLSAGNWHMWYGGGPGTNYGIGYATSLDGINWTKPLGNLIFHKDDGINWRNSRTYTPWVVYDSDSFSGHGDACPYKMWFTGVSTDGKYSVGYACATPIDAGPDQEACEGGNPIPLTGASPTGGTWSGTGISGSSFDPSVLLPGPYIVTYTYTNAKGCTSSDHKTVTINAKPTATASSNSPVCIGGIIQLTGGPDGMASYSWTGPDGFSNHEQSPSIPNATLTMAGDYILTVTDDNGCSGNATISVSVIQCGGGGGGGGGGVIVGMGGDINLGQTTATACPLTLVANMQGNATTASMTNDGVLCETCLAKDTAGRYTLEIEKGTKIMLAGNTVPRLLIFRESSAPPPAPENTAIVGPVYEISAYPTSYATAPSPVTISPPATLTLAYDPKELPKNATEVFIANYTAAEGWLALGQVPGTVAELGKAYGLASHFSPFAVLAKVEEPKSAEFEVSNLAISPPQVQPNQEVTISVNVANTGGKSGDYSLELKVDSKVKSTKQVTVAAGTSQIVNFTLTGDATGKHSVEISGLKGEFVVVGPSVINWWLIGGIAGIILLIIVVLIALRR